MAWNHTQKKWWRTLTSCDLVGKFVLPIFPLIKYSQNAHTQTPNKHNAKFQNMNEGANEDVKSDDYDILFVSVILWKSFYQKNDKRMAEKTSKTDFVSRVRSRSWIELRCTSTQSRFSLSVNPKWTKTSLSYFAIVISCACHFHWAWMAEKSVDRTRCEQH